jgi:hypothetical protein
VRKGNLVLNPRLDSEAYRVKTNNKTAMAYILGLPCIDRIATDRQEWDNDLIRFKEAKDRKKDVEEKRDFYLNNYDMQTIAYQWLRVLEKELYDEKSDKQAPGN